MLVPWRNLCGMPCAHLKSNTTLLVGVVCRIEQIVSLQLNLHGKAHASAQGCHGLY